MNITPEKYVERMLQISTKKYGLLKEIQEITRRQEEVITEETTERLNEFLDEKQKRIEDIDKLDEEFKVYYERLKFEMKVKSLEELQASSIKGVKELQLCISGILHLVDEISQLEKKNSEKANRLLEDLSQEIKKLNQGKKVNSLYSSTNPQPSAYFIDKKK